MFRVEVDVPSVESFVTSPLSLFIQFAVNECGYGGTRREPIANLVPPLCLKAKSEADKSDNPNWRQAVDCPFKE